MSAVGTILFIAQGAMRAKPEMKPWVHTDKSRMSSFRSGTNRASIRLRKVPPLWGSINIPITINPGLAPWAMQEYRPLGLFARPHQSIPQTQYNHNQIQKHKRNNSFTHPKTFYEHNTTTQHRKRPIRQIALKGRHSCKAQGGMRAKPEMKPWGNSKQQN